MSRAQWVCLGVMVSVLGCASGAPSPHGFDAQRDAGGEDGAATDGELEPDGPDDSADDGSDAMDPEAGDGGDDAEGEDGDTADPPVDPVHACCDDGDCLCHGYTPTELTVELGPYQTAELQLPLGTVSYPVDA